MITVGSKWVRNDYGRTAKVEDVARTHLHVRYLDTGKRERFGLSVFAVMFKEVV